MTDTSWQCDSKFSGNHDNMTCSMCHWYNLQFSINDTAPTRVIIRNRNKERMSKWRKQKNNFLNNVFLDALKNFFFCRFKKRILIVIEKIFISSLYLDRNFV